MPSWTTKAKSFAATRWTLGTQARARGAIEPRLQFLEALRDVERELAGEVRLQAALVPFGFEHVQDVDGVHEDLVPFDVV